MIRKQSTDPVFDQVSLRLSDVIYRNLNQKYVFLKKQGNTNFQWACDVNIARSFTKITNKFRKQLLGEALENVEC